MNLTVGPNLRKLLTHPFTTQHSERQHYLGNSISLVGCCAHVEKPTKKSEPVSRPNLNQTGAKLGSDFHLELADATQEKKKDRTQRKPLGKELAVSCLLFIS